jgi:hypothetical protein
MVVNILCLIGVWRTMPDDPSAWKWQDYANLGSTVASTGLAMAATLVRWRVDLALLKGFVQSPIVGPGLGYFVGALSIVEGAVSMRDALRTGDGWTFISGGFQFMSGALIIAGLFWTSPGLQLAGVVVGVAAAAVGLIEEAVKDKMVQFLEVLIAQIKAAKSTFDGSLLMKNIGINYMIDNIERYIPACKVTEIPCDTSWRGNAGESLGRWNIDSALEMLGIHDPALHSRLITNVSP